MAEDQRESRSVSSDYVVVEGGASNTNGVLALRPEETFSPDTLRLKYSENATMETLVTLYDEEYDTASEDLEDDFEAFHLSPGDRVVIENATVEDVANGIVSETDGNNDGALVISIGGVNVTN